MEIPDITDFSSTAHRLPTVSASQALQGLKPERGSRYISTGLAELDWILCDGEDGEGSGEGGGDGGVSRGQVAEIYGPPGSGTTSMGMQIAASALKKDDNKVIWVDCSTTLPATRLRQLVPETDGNGLDKVDHFTTPTLAHVLALFLHSTEEMSLSETSVIVVDSFSTVFAQEFPPRANDEPDERNGQSKGSHESATQQWALNRKWAILSELISALSKIAALNNIAVVLLDRTTSRQDADGGSSLLMPAVSSAAWDSGIATRIALFHDWKGVEMETASQDEEEAKEMSVRYATVTKLDFTALGEAGAGPTTAFEIHDDCLRDVYGDEVDEVDIGRLDVLSGSSGHKRKYDEVSDSEDSDDEDFGTKYVLDDDEGEKPEAPVQGAQVEHKDEDQHRDEDQLQAEARQYDDTDG